VARANGIPCTSPAWKWPVTRLTLRAGQLAGAGDPAVQLFQEDA